MPSDFSQAGPPRHAFPKSRRLVRRGDFRRVYAKGFRLAGIHTTAICLETDTPGGPRIGFALPRSLGGSVVRNRMKRRLREAIRTRLAHLPARWLIVLQPRRTALEAAFQELERDMEKLVRRCGG